VAVKQGRELEKIIPLEENQNAEKQQFLFVLAVAKDNNLLII